MGRKKVNIEDNTAVAKNKATAVVATEQEIKSNTEIQPLVDSDEIKVVSLIPNVSYKDKHTGDFYEWKNVDDTEFLTFEVLKNMWRNSKRYLREMWLKPLDDRVVEKFGLAKIYEKYEYLMNSENYSKENIKTICADIDKLSAETKHTICNKVKSLVVAEKINNVTVIRELEKHLNVDLTSLV